MTILEQNGRTQEAKREAFMIWDVLGTCRLHGPYAGRLYAVRQPGFPLLPFRVKKILGILMQRILSNWQFNLLNICCIRNGEKNGQVCWWKRRVG